MTCCNSLLQGEVEWIGLIDALALRDAVLTCHSVM